MQKDSTNDVAIILPSSLQVQAGITPLCEFDGLVIYPNRSQSQIVFLEAKNTSQKPQRAKNQLGKKFDKLHIVHDKKQIITVGHDAYYMHNV